MLRCTLPSVFSLLLGVVLGCTRPEVLPPDGGADAPSEMREDAPSTSDAPSTPDAPTDVRPDTPADARDAAVLGCSSDEDCDDGDACNGQETCDVTVAVCVPGDALSCPADANVCTVERCDPAVGCVSVPAEPGTVCTEDRLRCRRAVCTVSGTCPMPTSICVSPTAACCGDNVCVADMTAC